MLLRTVRIVGFSTLIALCSAHADGAVSTKGLPSETKLLPTPDGISSQLDRYGREISISGDRALVGAAGLQNRGGAIVYRRDGMGWVEEAILRVEDFALGISVSLDGMRALVASGSAAHVFERSDGEWTETAELVPADTFDVGSLSVSLDGDRALVGYRPFPSTPGPSAPGRAIIFEFEQGVWTERDTLSIDVPEDGFGGDVALDGDRAIVSATGLDDQAGAAIVFERTGDAWSQTATLVSDDPMANDNFGRDLDLIGDRAFVSRIPDSGDNGAVFVFDFDGAQWNLSDTLEPMAESSRSSFGDSLGADSDRVVIGAPSADDRRGAAHVFDFDQLSWTETQRIVAADGDERDEFGDGVALAGDVLLAGAPRADAEAPGAGAVYGFEFDTMVWEESDKLALQPGAGNGAFGAAVSLENDRAAVGASGDRQGRGAAFIYDREADGWELKARFTPDENAVLPGLGGSVSLDGDRLLVGANSQDGEGRAFIYEFDGENWVETDMLMADVPAFGQGFGFPVALLDNRALISTWPFIPGLEKTVFVFEDNGGGWVHTASLQPPESQPAFLPLSIALGPDWAFIGANSGDGAQPGSGVVFAYEFDGQGWSEAQPLFPAAGGAGASFGASLSVQGERLLVGAPSETVDGLASAGAAHVFELIEGQWTEGAMLSPREPQAGQDLGRQVSLAETRALVSARTSDLIGGAYVFDLVDGAWRQTQQLSPGDGQPGQGYGSAVAITQQHALVGSQDDPARGTSAGAAYIPGSTDLTITNAAGLTSVVPGEEQLFTVTVTNNGPGDVVGARVENNGAEDSMWTCQPGPGAVCPATGAGPLDAMVELPVGSSVVFSYQTTAEGTVGDVVTNTAFVAPPGSLLESVPADNVAVEEVMIVAGRVDLVIEKTDLRAFVGPNGVTEYVVRVANTGPDPVSEARVTDNLPPELTNASWTCEAEPGASCTAAGTGNLDDLADLAVGTSVTYVLRAHVNTAVLGTEITNTAGVQAPTNVAEDNLNNNSATDTSEVSDTVFVDGLETPE